VFAVVMTTTTDLLLLVTLTLTLASSPSYQSPHHIQLRTPSQLLDDTEELHLPATVGKLRFKFCWQSTRR